MTGVLFPNDGFNLTFGKDEWKLHNNYLKQQTIVDKVRTPQPKTNQRRKYSSVKNHQNKYALELQKVNKKNGTRRVEVDKQNLSLNANLHLNIINTTKKTRARRRSSFFNHDNKMAFNLDNNFSQVGEQISKQKNNFENSKVLKRQNTNILYELQLKNRLNEIQSSSKSRSERYHKMLSQHQSDNRSQLKNIKDIHIKKFEFNNLNRKTGEVQKASKSKYNEQMRHVDGLIEKINMRIKSSIKSHS